MGRGKVMYGLEPFAMEDVARSEKGETPGNSRNRGKQPGIYKHFPEAMHHGVGNHEKPWFKSTQTFEESRRKMDKSWMNQLRTSSAYLKGLEEFLDFALANASVDGEIICPCNVRDVVCLKSIINPSKTVAKESIQSIDPSTQVGGEELGPNWCEISIQLDLGLFIPITAGFGEQFG
ncbi:hypothetical protein RJ639_015825 [Escallonia herrerae]|uniref:Uncharacterized protein n=1 Tax=Escallonia herrerae TaxID=1293975 RepID=A0AA89ALW9_9ASTE|nr:hypothetical protein RJ639_015825 [Escallonia herrerae]